MGQFTDGQLPADSLGYRAEGVYVPGVGTVANQGGAVGSDASGAYYAPAVVTTGTGSVTALSGNTGIPSNIPAIVQKNKAVSTGGVASQTCAFTSNNTAGNTLVVVCGVGNTGAITVTDSLGNTYTKVTTATQGSVQSGMYFVSGCLGGGNTVTVTPSASVSVAVQIYELSGLVVPTLAPAQYSTTTSASGTAVATSALASVPNSYAFLGVAVGTAAQAVSVTTSSLFTLDSTQNVGGTPSGLFTFGSLSQFVDGIGPVVPQATIAGAEPYAAVSAIFRPVALPIQGTVTIGGYNYTRVTTAATTLVKTGPGVLHAIVVNKPTSTATIEADDALTNTTPVIGILGAFAASIAPFTVVYDVAFTTGLSVTVGVATVDATIVWR